MGRPTDWSLLGGSDPAPGSVPDMQEASRAWGENAGRLADAQDVLGRVRLDGAGSTVEAVQTLLLRDAALISVYRAACETNANIYRSWASSLEGFQAEADRLRVHAEQEQLEQAQGLALLHAQAPPSPFSDLATRPSPMQELWRMDRKRGSLILQGSNQTLAELQRQAGDLRERYRPKATGWRTRFTFRRHRRPRNRLISIAMFPSGTARSWPCWNRGKTRN